MKKFLLYYWLLIFVIIVTGSGTAHANDGCGFDQMMQDPAYAKQQMQKDQAIHDYLQGNPNARITPGGCEKPLDIEVTLPVVVHIVNTSAGSPLIPVSQVDSAMARMNRDFRNVAGFGPDTKMRFALAKRDPNGNATTGINYIDGSQLSGYVQYGINYFGSGNGYSFSGLEQYNWPIDRYINVFIINTFGDNTVGGIGNNNLIIDNSFFSENNIIFAHEMGHYFNLLHTYAGATNTACQVNNNCSTDGDQVCDTPPIKLGDVTSSTCYSGDISNTVNNIMGYGQVNRRFTTGQKDRMRAALYNGSYLWKVATSESLIPVTVDNEAAIDAIENNSSVEICDNTFVPQITLRNIGVNTLNAATVETYIDGVLKSTTNLSGLNIPRNGTKTVNLNSSTVTTGTVNVLCVITKVNGVTGDYHAWNNKICGEVYFYKPTYYIDIRSEYCYTSGTGSYPCSTLATVVATVADTNRHVFDRWSENGTTVSTVLTYSFPVNAERILTAETVFRTYTTNVVSSNTTYGTVTKTGENYYESWVTMNAVGINGGIFLYWKDETGTIVSYSSQYSFFLKKDKTLTAYFQAPQPVVYTIAVSSNDLNYGTTSTTGDGTAQSSFTVYAHTLLGSRFLYWTENGVIVSTDSIYQFTATGNRNLVAIFEQIATAIIQNQVQALQVYPNPATDWVTIKQSLLQQGTITVVGIDGTYHQIPWQERIDVSLLPTGMYIITIVSGGDTYMGKFIKK